MSLNSHAKIKTSVSERQSAQPLRNLCDLCVCVCVQGKNPALEFVDSAQSAMTMLPISVSCSHPSTSFGCVWVLCPFPVFGLPQS